MSPDCCCDLCWRDRPWPGRKMSKWAPVVMGTIDVVSSGEDVLHSCLCTPCVWTIITHTHTHTERDAGVCVGVFKQSPDSYKFEKKWTNNIKIKDGDIFNEGWGPSETWLHVFLVYCCARKREKRKVMRQETEDDDEKRRSRSSSWSLVVVVSTVTMLWMYWFLMTVDWLLIDIVVVLYQVPGTRTVHVPGLCPGPCSVCAVTDIQTEAGHRRSPRVRRAGGSGDGRRGEEFSLKSYFFLSVLLSEKWHTHHDDVRIFCFCHHFSLFFPTLPQKKVEKSQFLICFNSHLGERFLSASLTLVEQQQR